MTVTVSTRRLPLLLPPEGEDTMGDGHIVDDISGEPRATVRARSLTVYQMQNSSEHNLDALKSGRFGCRDEFSNNTIVETFSHT